MDSSNSNPQSRFTAPQPSAEDLLKEQTVGLVQLSDFRKRRAEAIEQKGRLNDASSGASTPREGYAFEYLW
jgi:protein FAM50